MATLAMVGAWMLLTSPATDSERVWSLGAALLAGALYAALWVVQVQMLHRAGDMMRAAYAAGRLQAQQDIAAGNAEIVSLPSPMTMRALRRISRRLSEVDRTD